MKIIENILPSSLQDYIENLTFSSKFEWRFCEDTAFHNLENKNNEKIPGFSHIMLEHGQLLSPFSQNFEPIFNLIASNAKVEFNTIDRVRFGLYLPLKTKKKHNNIHVDAPFPHTVLLYYVNDSDAPTYFFDENENIINSITPKKGSAVVFDGSTPHASSLPEQEARITLNINFKGLQI